MNDNTKQFKPGSHYNYKLMAIYVGVFSIIGITTLLLTRAASIFQPVTVSQLKADVRQAHDIVPLPGTNPGYDFANMPSPSDPNSSGRPLNRTDATSAFNLWLPWGYLSAAPGTPSNTNAGVEIGDMGWSYFSRSQQKWLRYDTEGPCDTNSGYIEDQNGSDAGNFSAVDTGNSTVITSLGMGGFLDQSNNKAHFWSRVACNDGGTYNIDGSDVQYVVSWTKARIGLKNQMGTDDRASIQNKYLMLSGLDYKMNYNCGTSNPCPSAIIGRSRFLTNEWQVITAHNMSATTIDAQAPNLVGVIPEFTLTNTLPTPTAKLNIVTAGDSIMAGSNSPGLRSNIFDNLKNAGLNFQFYGHKDSFWNGTNVETYTLPAFPNNRTAAVGGTCLLANNPNGCGFNPDGDTSQGIWGLIDQTINEMGSTIPNAYFVMGGINDRFCNLGATVINGQGIMACRQPFSDRYKDFLDRILARTPNAYIFFSTGKDFQNTDNYFDGVKDSLNVLAASYRAAGKKVYFIDAWAGVTAADMADSVHPLSVGAAKVATNYTTVATPLLNGGTLPPPVISPPPVVINPPPAVITPPPTGAILNPGTYEETSASYGSNWSAGGGFAQSGGADKYTYTATAAASIRFNGTSIKLYGAKAFNSGQATIIIDGGSPVALDYYAASRVDGALVFEANNLSSSITHTLLITMKATHNAAAASSDGKYYITIDSFTIATASAPMTRKCDFNNDNIIDTNDLFILLANFNKPVPLNTRGDCNSTSTVDTNDLFILLAGFGK